MHRPDQDLEEVFIDRRFMFKRDPINTKPDVRAIRTNRTIKNSLIRLSVLRKSWVRHRKRRRDRKRNDIRKHLVDNFFFQLMLPVIVLVDIVLITPLTNCNLADFLIRESGGPFGQVRLVEFLLCIHELILPL